MTTRKPVKPRVKYDSPTHEEIERYAHAVCRALSQTVDGSFDTPEVRVGFAAFMKIVVSINVRQLNREGEHGTHSEPPLDNGYG
jgi:hypothetical protein